MCAAQLLELGDRPPGVDGGFVDVQAQNDRPSHFRDGIANDIVLQASERTPAPMMRQPFSLHEESLSDLTQVIAVQGGLDADTTQRLTEAVKRVMETGRTHVVSDLRETTYLDSTALADLLRDARWLDSPGSAMAIVASRHAQPRGRFDMTGTRQVLSVCASREEALEIVDRPPAPSPVAPPSVVVRFSLYVDGTSANAAH